jgi:hypothetical protein
MFSLDKKMQENFTPMYDLRTSHKQWKQKGKLKAQQSKVL